MKKIITLLALILLTGCSEAYTKHTLDLKCENGLITFQFWRADVFDINTDIRQPYNLKKSGFYTDDNGKYMRCVEEEKLCY